MQAPFQTVIHAVEPTRFVEMVFPDQANHYGTLFGGAALSLMGKAAFVAATRRARRAVVMANSDKVQFHEPVRVGELSNSPLGRASRPLVHDRYGRGDRRNPGDRLATDRDARLVRNGRGGRARQADAPRFATQNQNQDEVQRELKS